MTVIAIWTGASLLIMLISAGTDRKNS
jgi:hypothetical protein